MNPTVFAMRRPVTTLMLVVALISGGVLAYNRMRVDIFPSLNTPKIYVFLDYIGMSPDQMEGFIVNQLELYFQYVDGIQDINTRNIQQVALFQLSFFPGTDMGQAMAQVVMILLFLRDLRSVIVVVTNIPLALLRSLFGLWVTGNTINIMSLGGMALAIGILVDMSTVLIENVRRHPPGS